VRWNELSSRPVSGTAQRSGSDLYRAIADRRFAKVAEKMGDALNEVFGRLKAEAPELYAQVQAQVGLLP